MFFNVSEQLANSLPELRTTIEKCDALFGTIGSDVSFTPSRLALVLEADVSQISTILHRLTTAGVLTEELAKTCAQCDTLNSVSRADCTSCQNALDTTTAPAYTRHTEVNHPIDSATTELSPPAGPDMSATVEVFLSYTHDTPTHKAAVGKLANDLRSCGLNARLDQEVNGTPPEGWPAWMERGLASATFVLVVCTEAYKRRYENQEVPGRGLGSQWEGAIVRQELYESPGNNTKFAAILFDPDDDKHKPFPLRPHTHYVYPRDRELLLRWLTRQPAFVPAALGKKPLLPPIS